MDLALVTASEAIATLAEARAYYLGKLAMAHKITCRNAEVTIVFEREGTHLFSEEVPDFNAIPNEMLVTRNIGGGRREVRQFCIDRARLMDRVLPAISAFTHCTRGQGAPSRSPRLMTGPRLACGRYMRVILRPGPDTAWTCLTAFPIDEMAYRECCRASPTRFPS